jgi:hypothetical protein
LRPFDSDDSELPLAVTLFQLFFEPAANAPFFRRGEQREKLALEYCLYPILFSAQSLGDFVIDLPLQRERQHAEHQKQRDGKGQREPNREMSANGQRQVSGSLMT